MNKAVRKVVIVTGASRGIGAAVCKVLLEGNANVVGVSRSALQDSRELADLAHSHSDAFRYLSLDVAAEAAASKIIEFGLSAFGRLDAVIHNAGLLDPISKIATADIAAWKKCFDVNFFAGLGLIQAAMPHLRANHGRIVLVSSGAAANAYKGWSAYCTSKAACNMLVAGLGLEEEDVVSVALRPGVVDTEMQQQIREGGKEAMGEVDHDRFVQFKDSGKLLSPDVPGYVIAKLALHAEKELSGQFISWDDARLSSFRKP
ncbi:hypothetical protein DFJ77DRAFT_451325 [Powellomyces hirtus]|nr:hypothetical protein DFJ77DRAFT_451325 [Powellomyces hirtus]